MKQVTLITLTALIASLGPADAVSPAAPRPNIVLVLADDLGYGDIGANGSRFIQTPNIDRMAREGVRLTSFFSSANVCSPSRAGLLTGRYPVRTGLARNVLYPFSTYGIDASEVTLPELLRSAGYDTWMVGKWHLGHVPEAWPTRHGFDHFFGLQYSNDMPGVALYRDEEKIEDPLDQAAVHGRFADEAVRLIGTAGDRPFFLYFAPVAPHYPVVPGPRFAGRSPAGRYGDVVEELDDAVGRILAALRHLNRDRNTLVIITSDNGRAFEGSSGSARGGKASTWEGGYAVPLVARWPAGIPVGARSDGIAMNIDLLPTLARLAGTTPPTDRPIDGKDIIGLLRGGGASPHDVLYFFEQDKIAAVRTQRWRYVVSTFYSRYLVDQEQINYPLLFDIERQGSELYNMAANEPQVEARMKALLADGRARLEGLPQRESPLPPPQDGR